MNYEQSQYHPRYARSEFHDLEDRERRQRNRAILFGLIGLLCAFGIVYIVS